MVDRAPHIPPWQQVRDLLRSQILSGELAPGTMLSIVSIHQEHNIAKTTARKVIRALKDEGLVTVTPGWGTFVNRAEHRP